jgi:hypothetical protein
MKEPQPTATWWVWFVLAFALGVGVEWFITHRYFHVLPVAWDTNLYWRAGVPVMIIGALLFGFLARWRPLPIGYAPFLGQLITMLVRNGFSSDLLPGTGFILLLGLVGVGAAMIGGALRHRLKHT